MISRAQDLGFVAVDTAPAYGDAEEIIGEASSEIPIHTKFAVGRNPEESIRTSLRRMRRTALDCVYFHETFEPNEKQLKTISSFSRKRNGTAFKLGASIYGLEEFEAVMIHSEITAIQFPASVLDRRFLGAMSDRAVAAGKFVFVRSVLLQGLVGARDEREISRVPSLTPFIKRFQEVCSDNSITVIEGAIGFLKRVLRSGTLVVGATSIGEMEEIASVLQMELSDSAFRDLEDLPQPPAASVDPRYWERI